MAKREMMQVEMELDAAEVEHTAVSEKLQQLAQQRINMEEELAHANLRLKQLLGELKAQTVRPTDTKQGAAVSDNTLALADLSRIVELSLMKVLEERFMDDAFTAAISEQSTLASAGKARVEFDGDEAYWSLHDNYTFEALLHDAARYWDIAPENVVFEDGAQLPTYPSHRCCLSPPIIAACPPSIPHSRVISA